MAIHLVLDWTAPQAHLTGTVAALEAVQAHILAEHPQIHTARLLRQVAGDQPHVAFRWEEEHASVAEFKALPMTEECDAVWLRVWELAVPGSHRQSIWDDGGKARWVSR